MTVRPGKTRPRPFLKWAGGKARLLSQFEPLFPPNFDHYVEPFVGSGAVFFHLWKRDALQTAQLCDHNPELINCFAAVRDSLDDLIPQLAEHAERHGREYFYRVRAEQPDALDPVARAARTIYLNKTCFNGLYRVNRRGEFNVPIGRYDSPRILDADNLTAASKALQGVELSVRDFRTHTEDARPGSFFYFDPPYHPVSGTANFTSYTAGAFGEADQRELAVVFRELDRRSCQLMLSNSCTPLVLEMYAGFRIELVEVSRAINSRADRRGRVKEVVVCNY